MSDLVLAAASLHVRPMEGVRAFMASYRDAIGAEAMVAAYGPHWPRPRLHGEDLFEFRDSEKALIGWGSLHYDPAERVTWHSHGIFPSYQDQGATRLVSRWLRAWAFEHHPGCVAVGCKILDTNGRFQAWMRHKNPNPGWQFAGHITLPPPGYDVHVFSRDYWQREEQSVPRG